MNQVDRGNTNSAATIKASRISSQLNTMAWIFQRWAPLCLMRVLHNIVVPPECVKKQQKGIEHHQHQYHQSRKWAQIIPIQQPKSKALRTTIHQTLTIALNASCFPFHDKPKIIMSNACQKRRTTISRLDRPKRLYSQFHTPHIIEIFEPYISYLVFQKS